jgi:hypothetical protein
MITVEYKNRYHVIEAFVVDTDAPPILGTPGIKELDLMRRVDLVKEQPRDDLYQDTPGVLEGEHNIQLLKGAVPVAQSSRKFPFGVHEKLRKELTRLESLQLIKSVVEPTPWVQQMAIVVKKDGSLRLCLDPRELNKVVVRERYTLPTADEIFNRMHGAQFFSFLDATQGFHHIKLNHKSSLLTTFNTPFGRYRWLRMPYGLASASEVFHRRMVECLRDLEGVEVFIDDIAVWGKTKKDHDDRLSRVLDRCRASGIHLNRKKCRICVKEATYLGHVLSADGLKVDPEKIQAIQDMPRPCSKEEVRRFLGMVTYLSKFISDCATKSEPLRALMKKDTEFSWGTDQEKSYQTIINDLSNPPTLALYDPKRDIQLSVDASQHGLGACLLQGGKPIAYASCSLTPTQQRYAQIEKEMLAIVAGCKRFHQFIWGQHCLVETDHKPLEAIFNKPMSDVSPRLLRMLMKLQNLDLTVQYKPGKELAIADHLSRSHLSKSFVVLEKSLEKQVLQIKEDLSLPPESWSKYIQATEEDEELQELRKQIEIGWPVHKRELENQSLGPYWNIKEDLYVHQGVIFRKRQIVVPRTLRKTLLVNLHLDHSGLTRSLSKAREAIYWPNINKDIERVIGACEACQRYSKGNRKEPMIPGKLPEYPFQRIGMDYFENAGKLFLVIIDAYSHWFNIYPVASTDFLNLSNILKSHFTEHGTPEEVCTDNGPPFQSHRFRQLCEEKDIKHNTSSPKFPQSNGLVERAVQTAKVLLNKCKASNTPLDLALMEHRNTPFAATLPSPSELALGRKLRTHFPHKKSELQQSFHVLEDVVREYNKYKAAQKEQYDCGAKPLQPLKKEEKVWIRKEGKWFPGEIVEMHSKFPRSYLIRTESGSLVRRNRRDIKTRTDNHVDEDDSYLEEAESEEVPEEHQRISRQGAGDSIPKTRYGRVVQPPVRYGFS